MARLSLVAAFIHVSVLSAASVVVRLSCVLSVRQSASLLYWPLFHSRSPFSFSLTSLPLVTFGSLAITLSVGPPPASLALAMPSSPARTFLYTLCDDGGSESCRWRCVPFVPPRASSGSALPPPCLPTLSYRWFLGYAVLSWLPSHLRILSFACSARMFASPSSVLCRRAAHKSSSVSYSSLMPFVASRPY